MNKKRLSVFFLAMMNVAVIMSLRGLPMMAKEGDSLLLSQIWEKNPALAARRFSMYNA